MKNIPNKESLILQNASIGGVGLSLNKIEHRQGMSVVLLYVPNELITNKSILEVQDDIGMPWLCNDGDRVWLKDLVK